MRNRFYNAFDTERLEPAPQSGNEYVEYRTPFQVDRDRIMHTPAFRSLQSKTQVFWSGEYDFYRTRLTHSLEVAQIGRSICHWLSHSSQYLAEDFRIDNDLVEACCLAHDLGHPPFGHAGEKSLNALMATVGGFEGNAQTLRLLTKRIFSTSKRGMNPTRALLDGVLKYKTLWSELITDNGTPPTNHFIYDNQNQYLDWVLRGRDFPIEYSPGKPRDSFRSIELQIMDWADDTAYSLNDVADSVRAGFLNIASIEQWASHEQLSSRQNHSLEKLLEKIREGTVEVMMSRKIGDFIQATSLKEEQNFMSSTSNRYKYSLEIENGCHEELKMFKKLAYDVVFRSPELNQLEYKGDYLLNSIWQALSEQYLSDSMRKFNLLDSATANELNNADPKLKMRILCDSVASMTDGSATRLYKRLKIPDFGSIGDLV